MSDPIILCPRRRPWHRHELLRITSEFWASALPSRLAIAAAPFLATWADQGWPVIVRRRMVGDHPDMVPVGIPLPPAAGKQRIALTVPDKAVLERWPPPSLWTVQHVADPGWEPAIHALVMLGARHGVSPAAFGSLLWQYRTGLHYLSPRSDMDVLWPVQVACKIGSLLAGIAAVERIAPMRIDGEVVFPDGSAVNWRELHNALNQNRPAEVLVKSMGGASLLNVPHLPRFRKAV